MNSSGVATGLLRTWPLRGAWLVYMKLQNLGERNRRGCSESQGPMGRPLQGLSPGTLSIPTAQELNLLVPPKGSVSPARQLLVFLFDPWHLRIK